MATVKNPVLFSSYFGISPQILAKAGLIDIFLNVDTPLFVDPVLLDKSSNQLIETTGAKNVRDRFSEIVGLLAISRQHGDVAWRNAARRLDLSEPPETGLGYGSSSKSGSSRPNKIKEAILETSKEIIELGCRDPEMISLMGFLENGVGADTISDFTTHAIFENLCEITRDFCVANQIAVHGNDVSRNFKLPIYKRSNGTEHPVELTSSGTCRRRTIGAKSNKQLFRVKKRDRVNQLLGGIAKPTVADRKAAIRKATMSSLDYFEHFLASVKEYSSFYDPNIDTFSYYKFRRILGEDNRSLIT